MSLTGYSFLGGFTAVPPLLLSLGHRALDNTTGAFSKPSITQG